MAWAGMKIFIVHAHHEPKSFNGALTGAAKATLEAAGHTVIISDLHAMNFDPVSDRRNFTVVKDSDYLKQQAEEEYASAQDGFAPDIAAEIDKLEWCDALIMQFPLWWFGLPAILKGWVDRVFVRGRLYGSGRWYDNGALRGRRAMLSLTTGGPATMYGEDGLNGQIDRLLYPINHGILRFVGFDVLPPFVAWGPARAGDDQRRAYLDQYRARLGRLETETPISYPPLADFEPGTWRKRGSGHA